MRAKMKTEAIKISVSLYDAALASLANQATNYLIAKHTPKRIGSKHPNIAPYGELFQTSDQRTITFAIGSDQQFNQLVDLLGVDELKKFESNQSRVQHRTEIEQALQKKVAGWKADNLLSACIERMIPAAIIRNLNEILNDEEVQKLLLEDEIGKRLRTAIYKIES
jgi:crotonobetainyl-CoA:carnitine CoA-transferase CaiB-like acyl-CoA transferase